ncbi:hypothetical protein XHC_3446 [Xanthomonas hortorum pv. carotae str. M081]|nr:hypothetical protein XHC_3446 [Xanthomonas hortorum pv. carotae str. M081]
MTFFHDGLPVKAAKLNTRVTYQGWHCGIATLAFWHVLKTVRDSTYAFRTTLTRCGLKLWAATLTRRR